MGRKNRNKHAENGDSNDDDSDNSLTTEEIVQHWEYMNSDYFLDSYYIIKDYCQQNAYDLFQDLGLYEWTEFVKEKSIITHEKV